MFEGSLMTNDNLIVAMTRFFPIDDLEEGIDEQATIRAVVVVIGVFPDVERENRM